jgi:hypothetical protein
MASKTRSAAVHGQSTGRMKTRPSKLKTATETPLSAETTTQGLPGAEAGKLAGFTIGSSASKIE